MKTYQDAMDFLTGDQRDEVADAISKAEAMTSGEIRVLVVAASSVLPVLGKNEQRKSLGVAPFGSLQNWESRIPGTELVC